VGGEKRPAEKTDDCHAARRNSAFGAFWEKRGAAEEKERRKTVTGGGGVCLNTADNPAKKAMLGGIVVNKESARSEGPVTTRIFKPSRPRRDCVNHQGGGEKITKRGKKKRRTSRLIA